MGNRAAPSLYSVSESVGNCMASIEHSYFPQWESLDRPRKVRHTLSIALVATAVGMTAGGSTVAFLVSSPVTGPSLSSTSSTKGGSSLGIDQRIADQSSLEIPKLESPQGQPRSFDKAASHPAPQLKPPADSQPALPVEPSASPPESSSANVAPGTRRTELGKRDHVHSAGHTRKNYRTKFGGFFSPFPNRNRGWFSARTRYQSNLSPL